MNAGRFWSWITERVHDAGRLEEQGSRVHRDHRVIDQGDDPSFKDDGDLILARMCVWANEMLGSKNCLHHGEAAVRQVMSSDLQGHVRGECPTLAGLNNRHSLMLAEPSGREPQDSDSLPGVPRDSSPGPGADIRPVIGMSGRSDLVRSGNCGVLIAADRRTSGTALNAANIRASVAALNAACVDA